MSGNMASAASGDILAVALAAAAAAVGVPGATASDLGEVMVAANVDATLSSRGEAAAAAAAAVGADAGVDEEACPGAIEGPTLVIPRRDPVAKGC